MKNNEENYPMLLEKYDYRGACEKWLNSKGFSNKEKKFLSLRIFIAFKDGGNDFSERINSCIEDSIVSEDTESLKIAIIAIIFYYL